MHPLRRRLRDRCSRALRAAVALAGRAIVRAASAEFSRLHDGIAGVRASTDALAATVAALEARLTADVHGLGREVVQLRAQRLAIDELRRRLAAVAADERREMLRLEQELSEAGAQRSYVLRELARLMTDLDSRGAQMMPSDSANSTSSRASPS